MNALTAAQALGAAFELAGETVVCDHRGVLFVVEHGLLVVSDLHLEKGAAYARRGVFLPPYDTAETLTRLESVMAAYRPRMVISLGDSFHDRVGSALLPEIYRDRIAALAKGRDWFWVTGNHDPDAPSGLPGDSVVELSVGGLTFRHEPTSSVTTGEVGGHLHPGARVIRRGRAVRRPCFATDGKRLVMPAFGALTGALNVLDKAYAQLFDWSAFRAHVMGRERVFTLGRSVLYPG